MDMNSSLFSTAMQNIMQKSQKFDAKAYQFVVDALDYAVTNMQDGEGKHVSAEQLLKGFRNFALEKFGPMSMTILREWGIQKCADVGEIVFNLIAEGAFEKQPDDRPEDFIELYSFEEAFLAPFQPKMI